MKHVKHALLIAMLLAAVWVLVFGPRSALPIPKDRVVIHYWEKWTGKEAEQMTEIVEWFNQTVGKEKGIFVQYLSMSTINQKTLVSTAAGVPPDVAGLWDTQVPQFAAMDALEPLDELAAAKGITRDYYKPTYWDSCTYDGRLYAMISTPAAAALLWNRQIFAERADSLRAAGLDPDRPPRTLDELDRYAKALDVYEDLPSGRKRIRSSGYLPMEPGWFLNYTGFWFGTSLFDPVSKRVLLDTPEMNRAMEWVQSYSKRLGKESMNEFRGGFGQFNSTQNPFLTGDVAMVQQGPWMGNYIENLKPAWNRYRGIDREVADKLPIDRRRDNYQWAAAAFPSAVDGLENVTYAGFDILVIPRGAKHKREAFEFIAFVNRQDVVEKLNQMHSKNSQLMNVSPEFIANHTNPYISVFETLAASPNAHGVPSIPVWPEMADELNVAVQRIYLLEATPKEALAAAQARVQLQYDRFLTIQARREAKRR